MKRRTWILLGAGIAVLAIGAVWLQMQQRGGESEEAPNRVLPVVSTVMPSRDSGRVTVYGTGAVRPLREVTLAAEVAGRITWVAKQFVTGGSFREGDVILRIDSSDYVNAITVARAEVTQRKLDLLRAKEQVAVSMEDRASLERRTGVKIQIDSTELGSLVLREPQRNAAAAMLQSAQARLQDAEARLERTRIAAPFNGRVRSKSADLGQFVGPGYVVASYYGTDAVEVDVPIAGRDVGLLGDLLTGGARPTNARVIVRNSGGPYEWEGIVHRTEGALTEATRTLNAVVRVQRPYAQGSSRPPLMVGTFVSVYLEGRQLDRYYKLPRAALREGSAVWIVRNGRLASRSVEVLQEVEDTLFVTGGVTSADSVVTSLHEIVVEGMRVRIQED